MLVAWLAGTMLAGGAAAQVAPATIPDVRSLIVPTPTPTPVPTPTPSPTPTPTPTPRPTPTATPTPSARATPASQPSARATPASRPTATPTPRPLATPTPAIVAPGATPSSTPTPAVLATPTPTPTPEAAATPLAADGEPARPAWLIPAALIALALGGAAWFVRRRRRELESFDEAPFVAPPETPPPAAPLPPIEGAAPPLAPVAPEPRFLEPAVAVARLDLDPPTVARAGVNLVTATADVTVTVRNVSDVPATGVALEVRLTSAQPGQDAAVAAMFADAVARPATAPFDLAPGESRRVRTLATMPRDDIVVLTAAERPMFVPVVAIRAAHGGGQTVSVHALGIERPGQAKLGPFWLDQPPRMFDAIGVRPHTGR